MKKCKILSKIHSWTKPITDLAARISPCTFIIENIKGLIIVIPATYFAAVITANFDFIPWKNFQEGFIWIIGILISSTIIGFLTYIFGAFSAASDLYQNIKSIVISLFDKLSTQDDDDQGKLINHQFKIMS